MSILFTWLYLIGRGSAWLAIEVLTAAILIVGYGARRFTTLVDATAPDV